MKESLTEKIYTELRNKILDGEITPREFISESQIAQSYQVSKAPVKQALHILSSQGYLTSYPRKGYMVSAYSSEEINKIQEIRRCLESLCVRLAVQNASDEEILSLRMYEGMDKNNMDPRDAINTKFHNRLAEISGNEFLPETLMPLILKSTMSRIRSAPDIEHFEKIVQAMLARDEELAVRLICEDVRNI